MKKVFRIAALIIAVVMLAASLCGCSAFVQGFIEGYSEAMSGNSNNQDNDDNDNVFLFDNDDGEEDEKEDHNSGSSYTDEDYDMDAAAAAIFASNTGDFDASDLVGSWIDYEDDIIEFNSDGTANYFGDDVDSYSFNGEFVTFNAYGDDYKYPARLYGDTFVIFYEPYYYARTDGDTGSFTGRWESSDGNEYSFDFYSDGVFCEDDEYVGCYYIEGNDVLLLYSDGTIVYGIFYLHEDGNQLGFAYGWELERMN